MRRLFLLVCLMGASLLPAQAPPFGIYMEPVSIPGLGGLQSYAFGRHDGKWLILGGRTDGLHLRQPFASFDAAGNNQQIWVIDPTAGLFWTSPLAPLPGDLRDQLGSTNMEFHQEGDYLYLIGGYGYSSSGADPYTYDFLTAVNVSGLMNAVITGGATESYFRQISHPDFAVTGGHLEKIYDVWYLVGGQQFDGRYNPMGPTHGPGFYQAYSNAARRFTLEDDGVTLTLAHLPSIVDTNHLHRRDFNVVPQIMPDGNEGLTAFSGVFQKNADWPYLNCVNIDSNGIEVNDSFAQYYNHYHCAVLPLYSASSAMMHTVFFGGIAQYYDSAGILTQDNNVPFIKSIARVTRDTSGLMQEFLLPVEMPSLLGAGSEFIALESNPVYGNDVIRLDDLTADTNLVGYIWGGIASTAANIFFVNDGSQSSAGSQLFRVFVIKSPSVGFDELNEQSSGTLHLQVDPNPNDGTFYTRFFLERRTPVRITITSLSGKILVEEYLENAEPGVNRFQKRIRGLNEGGVYFITIDAGYESATQRIIVTP
jgi:hypothetical protein